MTAIIIYHNDPYKLPFPLVGMPINAANIIAPEANYHGMSYGDWVAEWCNWLCSARPFYNGTSDVIFLKEGYLGYDSDKMTSIQNIREYDYPGSRVLKEMERATETRSLYNRVGLQDGTNLGELITLDTAIFIPILTSMVWRGSTYDGRSIDTLEDMKDAVRKDTDETPGNLGFL